MATAGSLDHDNSRPSMPDLSKTPSTAAPHHPNHLSPEVPANKSSGGKGRNSRETASSLSNELLRFVLTDPVAFRYLEDDIDTAVLDRHVELEGYEIYVIEQWAVSRSHPTFVVSTYTGDPNDKIFVDVLGLPLDESTWSPKLRVYFRALNQLRARRRDTALGVIMVTNLTEFASSLTVIPVPDGDLRRHRLDFYVNENLKRMGCSGRIGLTIAAPSGTTAVKFHQLYRTSDRNDIYKAVIELVKLCQVALVLFDKLGAEFADGLLCDVTEKAISDWWLDMGNEYYQMEPHDGIMGPTTVAALLGLLMGARNRLHAVNAPVGKEAFDIATMKSAIGWFQKQQRLNRTRRLDRRTLERLHRTTQRAANTETWKKVPKAVKSTVAELSGKGGEMVMDAVGRRDKAGLAEVETCDIERFVQLASGERSRWLWHARPLKKTRGNVAGNLNVEERALPAGQTGFAEGEHGTYAWEQRKSDDVVQSRLQDASSPTSGHREGAFDRLKGAVGLGHAHHNWKANDNLKSPQTGNKMSEEASERLSPTASKQSRPQSTTKHERTPSSQASLTEQRPLDPAAITSDVKGAAQLVYGEDDTDDEQNAQHDHDSDAHDDQRSVSQYSSQAAKSERQPSIAESNYHGIDLKEILPSAPSETNQTKLLKRTKSHDHPVPPPTSIQPRASKRNRFLSFSLVEPSILTWPSLFNTPDLPFQANDLRAQLADQEFLAREAITLQEGVTTLHASAIPWTQSRLDWLHETLLPKVTADQEHMESLHGPLINGVRSAQANSEGMVRDRREMFEEGARGLETLVAKLEYEIGALRSRVEDVEEGVRDFERGVVRMEERADALEGMARRAVGGYVL